jgi:hypothetical protein
VLRAQVYNIDVPAWAADAQKVGGGRRHVQGLGSVTLVYVKRCASQWTAPDSSL